MKSIAGERRVEHAYCAPNPLAGSSISTGGATGTDAFNFGLSTVLDGIQALIARRAERC